MWPFSKPKPEHTCWKHHLLIFLAGAEAFHTLTHLMIAFSGSLPIRFFGMEWDQKLNLAAIAINALVTVALLYWASREHHSH